MTARYELHHLDDARERGVGELRRLTRGPVVIVTYDAAVARAMWPMDYLPEVAKLDGRIFPPTEQLCGWLGGSTRVEVIPIARDTPDWTLGSFWAHPERVLDPAARVATSGFAPDARSHRRPRRPCRGGGPRLGRLGRAPRRPP